MRNKGVLFDKDGTLLDFEATWFPVVQRVINRVKDTYRVPEPVLTALRGESGITESGFVKEGFMQTGATSEILALWEEVLVRGGIDLEPGDLSRTFGEEATGAGFAAHAVPGIEVFLAHLKGKGYRLGVMTSDDRASTEHSLHQARLWSFFDFIATAGDGFPTKPDPTAAAVFRDRFELAETGLAMFGDSVVDMEFAKNAGARFIGIKTSFNDYSRFLDEGFPVIEDFLDIEAIVRMLP